jgi:hypothetical protein
MAGVAPPRAVARLRLDPIRVPYRGRSIATRLAENRDAIAPPGCDRGFFPMMDVVMLGFAIGLFVLAIGYTYACERL